MYAQFTIITEERTSHILKASPDKDSHYACQREGTLLYILLILILSSVKEISKFELLLIYQISPCISLFNLKESALKECWKMLVIVSVDVIQIILYTQTTGTIIPSLCSRWNKCFIKTRYMITVPFLYIRKLSLFAVIVLLLGEHLSS